MPQLPEAARALCDRCIGRRLIGAAGRDAQRGAAGPRRLWPEVPEADCPICEGAFAHQGEWLAVALEAAAPYRFSTFQVGTLFPGECEEHERAAARAFGQEKAGESIRTEANRVLAAATASATGARTDPTGTPDLVITVDTRTWTATVEANAVFVRGRYNKLRRDIPQTHWPCRRCEGRGCWECDDSGVNYAESVEDAIGVPALPLFEADGYSFHGAGREDIDALMLGTGRPFVLELRHPHRREADLATLEDAINAVTARTGVAVRELRMAGRDEVAAIKEGEYGKEYVAHCIAEKPVDTATVEAACAKLSGATLEQRTPERVSHRRADLVRRRKLHSLRTEGHREDPSERFSIRVVAESGTYIKEMVSGDEGRTTPSLSQALGVPVRVEFLDVVAILDDAPKVPGEES